MPARRSPRRACCSAMRSPRARSSRASPMPSGRRGSSASRSAGSMLMWPTAPRSGSTAATMLPAAKSSPTRLAELDERVPRPVHLVFGMMETKDAHAFIAPFKGLVERVYTVPIPDEPNAFDADALAEIARAEGFDVVAPRACRTRSQVAGGAARAWPRADLRLALSCRPRAQAARLNVVRCRRRRCDEI